MKHKISHKKLSRTSAHRSALAVNLCSSLFLYKKITTTKEKSAYVLSKANRIINKAKKIQDQILKIRYIRDNLSRSNKHIYQAFLDYVNNSENLTNYITKRRVFLDTRCGTFVELKLIEKSF